MENILFISQPMTGFDDDAIRAYRQRVQFLVSIMIDDPEIELIDQFDVMEDPDEFEGLNENQIRQYRLHRSLEMMKDANIVVFAPGWWNSPGCIQEYIERKLYMRGALVIFGNQIQDMTKALYGETSPEYDFEAEKKVMDSVDALLKNLTNKPAKINIGAPSVKYKELVLKPKAALVTPVEKEKETSFDPSFGQGELTFRDYVDQYIGEDKKYFILLQETLTNMFLEEIENQYGKRKSKVTVNFDNIKNRYVCSICVFPTNDEKISYEFESNMYSTKDENSEYLDGYMFININKNDRCLQAFRVDYISSQISPVFDDRISQSVKIGYVTTAKISDKIARRVLSKTNKRFKEFVVDRDDMEYYNLGNL